jgi:hypothetical protein
MSVPFSTQAPAHPVPTAGITPDMLSELFMDWRLFAAGVRSLTVPLVCTPGIMIGLGAGPATCDGYTPITKAS